MGWVLGIHDTGNVWTASAHVITAVIGSGVLSLAWSIAQMGWLMGPVVLLLFAVVTYFTSMLLADSYRHPDPVTGKRNYTYMDTVRANLGESTDSIDTSFPRPPACVHDIRLSVFAVRIVVLAACKLVAEAWLISWSMKFVTVCEVMRGWSCQPVELSTSFFTSPVSTCGKSRNDDQKIGNDPRIINTLLASLPV